MVEVTTSISFTSVNGFSFLGPPFEIQTSSPNRVVFISDSFFPESRLTVTLKGQGLDQIMNAPENGVVNSLLARLSHTGETLDIRGFDLPYASYVEAYSRAGFAGVIQEISTGADTFRTSGEADIIRTYRGDDLVFSNGGPDRVFGEAGDDTLIGGAGDDTMVGGAGADRIIGGDGDDQLFSGGGSDLVFGGTGQDTLQAGGGDDLLKGGGKTDLIRGGAGDDSIFGGRGADALIGGKGDDRLIGGAGADTLFGGGGADMLTGSGGKDTFVFRNASSDAILDFAPSVDRIALAETLGIADFAELARDHLRAGADGVQIMDGDSLIVVVADTDIADLTESDFLFG